MNRIFCVLVLFPCVALIIGCSGKNEHSESSAEIEKSVPEKHRPLIHFSPAKGWMNDPNGMFFLDGEYHLFYQHYPDSTVWGPMHWGHAVSKDLVHWEHLPIALYPDSLGYIFSGSAVVDTHNTSGFGSPENPAVVAIYTYHDDAGRRAERKDFQSQAIAYSTDKGRTWTKYDGNPVLKSPGIEDFRDPKVSWIENARQWVMTLAVKDHIEFYGSPDLKQWKKLSEFGKNDGAHGGVWECPDLFEMTDASGKKKFVLLVSINPGAPNGGSGTQYFIGNFDGQRFISDTPGRNGGWIDYGTDNYAGVTFDNVPATDGRRLFVGWMSNWQYANVVPTSTWRSAATIPRTLALEKSGNTYLLRSAPVVEMNRLIRKANTVNAASGVDTIRIASKADSMAVPMIIRGDLSVADFVFEMSNSKGQKFVAGYDEGRNEFYIDRSVNMPSDFHSEFKKRIIAPRASQRDTIGFVAVIDVSSVEFFFDNGATTMTAITFPDEVFNEVKIYGTAPLNTGPINIEYLSPI